MVLNEHTPEFTWKDIPEIDFTGDVDASSVFFCVYIIGSLIKI